MEDWKRMFASHILLRGYDYYTDGRVWDLKKEGGRYTAVVAGTEDYSVTITADDEDNVIEMTCTCPYAEDGTHCKHEAAVLYKIRETDDKEESTGKVVSRSEEAANIFKRTVLAERDRERDELKSVIDVCRTGADCNGQGLRQKPLQIRNQ